ncbi:MAG: peptidase [Methanobacterium sp.]|nr:peptidase [Methanobacterium sp.]
MDIMDLINNIMDSAVNFIYSLYKLEPGWEKKALIILGLVVLVITVYAFNPFSEKPEIEVHDGPVNTPVTTPQQSPVISNNSNASDNTTNITITNGSNGTFQISADQAKQIALNSNPGYMAGDPTQGTITLNNEAISVWIVPLMKGSKPSMEVYVDSATGMVVGTKII